ncbi:50S ribosomal protein L5 [Candidatus Parcubacteria bacterium]|nr:50S ribosomal protein L5 [Candidatus Parcubacteria bacterium]
MTSLQEKYKKEVIPAMMEKLGYTNPMAVPKIEKVVVNNSFGRLISGKTSKEQEKVWKSISDDLTLITGQKSVLTQAKKSIAGFKIRQGVFVGIKITLRRKKMYDFLSRLIDIALPRSRDFQGIKSSSVDKNGNLTIGIKEHICFPEIAPEKSKFIFGFEVIVATTAKTKEQGLELLKLMGFPIKKNG